MKSLVVVLGMHRSGTSAITRALAVLGINLGNRHFEPREDNPKGFWEDVDIHHLNETLLRALHRDALSMEPVTSREYDEVDLNSLRSQAVQLLHEKLGQSDKFFGVKDPRFAKLLPFWRQVFLDAEVDVRYIIACRNPLSVAHSLRERDGFPIEKSWYLWFQHQLSSLSETVGCPRIVIDYDRLIDDPRSQLARLAQFLDLPFDPGSGSFLEYRDGFLDPLLRHTKFSKEDLLQVNSKTPTPPSIIKLYSLLCDLADDLLEIDQEEVITTIKTLSVFNDDIAALLKYAGACERETISDQPKPIKELSEARLYISEYIGGRLIPYGESRSVACQYTISGAWMALTLSLPQNAKTLAKLRFDPASTPAAIVLHRLALQDVAGSELWRWDGGEAGFTNMLGVVLRTTAAGPCLLCYNDDPQFELVIPDDVLQRLGPGCALVVEMTPKPLLDVLPEVLDQPLLPGPAVAAIGTTLPPPPSVTHEFVEVAQLMKAVIERRNATVASQQTEIEVLRGKLKMLESHVQRAEAQLDVLKEFVLAAFGKSIERI